MRSVRRRIQKTTKILDGKLDTLKAKVTGNEEEGEKAKAKSKEEDRECLTRQSSSASKASKDSNASKASKRKVKVPVFDPAAPAASGLADNDSSDEEGDDEHAFDHPSTYVSQAWIWLPRDCLGLSEVLANDLKMAGVDASDIGASMDEKGVVEVTRNPPDEEWTGGHDR